MWENSWIWFIWYDYTTKQFEIGTKCVTLSVIYVILIIMSFISYERPKNVCEGEKVLVSMLWKESMCVGVSVRLLSYIYHVFKISVLVFIFALY